MKRKFEFALRGVSQTCNLPVGAPHNVSTSLADRYLSQKEMSPLSNLVQ